MPAILPFSADSLLGRRVTPEVNEMLRKAAIIAMMMAAGAMAGCHEYFVRPGYGYGAKHGYYHSSRHRYYRHSPRGRYSKGYHYRNYCYDPDRDGDCD